MIHKFALRGHYIVLDINSGAVHYVDKLIYHLLDHAQPPLTPMPPANVYAALPMYSRGDLDEAWGELLELEAAGSLFSPDDYAPIADQMVESPIKAMCLNVSHDCNLRCEYCFAGKGDYDGERMVMDFDTAKRAIDFLIRHSEGRENLELDFFGGEPLLNFEVVKQTVAYARSLEAAHNKRFRFTITTNGLLLDNGKIDFINREMSNVVLSLDGRKTVNDKVRARVDGSGCYEAIVPKFQQLVKSRGDKEYYVRGTFTAYNKDFTQDVAALSALGFDQISVEPVVSYPFLPYALTEKDLPDLSAEYERLTDLILHEKREGNSFNFFHFMLDLDQGPCVIKRLRGCGCGNEYVAVTPGGDIYPCHQFIGHKQWKMGSLHDDSFDFSMKNRFSKNSVYQKADCLNCWAKFYCSGGCSANNMQYMGDITKPVPLSCELEKKRLECAIVIKAEMALQEVPQK